MNKTYYLNKEQRKFLMKILELEDRIGDYDCLWPVNIKSILDRGYYTGVQQGYIRTNFIPKYKRWKKKLDCARAKFKDFDQWRTVDTSDGMKCGDHPISTKWGYWEDE